MATVHDVAAYILSKQGEMTAMKLEKLVYYSQAWHVVWESEPLFAEPIEAWANGPVCPALYRTHRGSFKVSEWPEGDAKALTDVQRANIDLVIGHYGEIPAWQLSEMTHREAPWKDARGDLTPGQRGHEVITVKAMDEYYQSLL